MVDNSSECDTALCTPNLCPLICVTAPKESKLDIEAIKEKVKKAKTKKLGAPLVRLAPPSDGNKKKTKNKG